MSKAYVYVGLAGETAPGRSVSTGLYRMEEGSGHWELLTNGLPEAPAIRALAVHPEKPEIMYAGTQVGPYRTTDQGDHWEKVNVPDHGLPVWSMLYSPRDPNVMYAGYEAAEIYRSEDGGEKLASDASKRAVPRRHRGAGFQPCQTDFDDVRQQVRLR